MLRGHFSHKKQATDQTSGDEDEGTTSLFLSSDDDLPGLEVDDREPSDSDDTAGPTLNAFRGWNKASSGSKSSADHKALVKNLVGSTVTRKDAVCETNRGLKKPNPRKAALKVGGARQAQLTSTKKAAKGKGKAKMADPQSFRIQTVMLIPCGIVKAKKETVRKYSQLGVEYEIAEKEWRKPWQVASRVSMLSMKSRKLCNINVKHGFKFERNLSSIEVKDLLTEILPEPMQYLDSTWNKSGLPYVLCSRMGHDIIVAPAVDQPTGEDVFVNTQRPGRGIDDSVLIIAAKKRIPEDILEQWKPKADIGLSSDEESEHEDSFDVASTPPLPGRKRKASDDFEEVQSADDSSSQVAPATKRPRIEPISERKPASEIDWDDDSDLFDFSLNGIQYEPFNYPLQVYSDTGPPGAVDLEPEAGPSTQPSRSPVSPYKRDHRIDSMSYSTWSTSRNPFENTL